MCSWDARTGIHQPTCKQVPTLLCCVGLLLLQLLVRAAYDGALGHPLIPDPDNLHHLTPEALSTFVRQNYTGELADLAADTRAKVLMPASKPQSVTALTIMNTCGVSVLRLCTDAC